jgi:bisanhydrobacterioruberin hydratase
MYLFLNKISDSLIRHKKYVQIFFIIFYSVGLFGIYTSFLQKLFINLIPIALLLSFIVILFFHQSGINIKTFVVLFIIALSSFFIEVIGVNTGAIFGHYLYGTGLGIQIFSTPLLIGINWVLLVYCSASVTEKINTHYVFRIILASLLMLGYDLILEQIAPFMDMWYWQGNHVPLQNYLAWFIIAILLHSIVRWTGLKFRNQIAATIFICQALFFLSLIILR